MTINSGSANGSTAHAVLSRMVQMFATGDLAALADTVSESYVDHQGLNGAEILGSAGFARVVQAARQLRDLDVRVQDLFAQDDRAVARLSWHGVGADGRTVERETIDIVRVSDGLAVEHWGSRPSEY